MDKPELLTALKVIAKETLGTTLPIFYRLGKLKESLDSQHPRG
jgi:hypothetical protein